MVLKMQVKSGTAEANWVDVPRAAEHRTAWSLQQHFQGRSMGTAPAMPRDWGGVPGGGDHGGGPDSRSTCDACMVTAVEVRHDCMC